MKTTPVRRLTQAGVITVCVAALAACGTSSRSYNVSGAPGGDSAACSRLMDKAPQRVGGHGREDSGPKGTAVWGDGDVILRCGNISDVPESAPCTSVDGVDWVVNEKKSQDGKKTVLSYGRAPTAEIAVSERVKDKDAVVRELSAAVSGLAKQKACTERG
ncbi:DUF3515 domain-containing protein [Streptomyces sp. NBC_01387]|uniref:DUF3515 family protein n=1 Tax=unclassified Streptomyces TaxID=2593676 RepID=UPI002025B0D6|nr:MULTISPECIES: DUF3515 family protein [unclassified Streptomyces]WSC19093.1 DUF3515 domain-containing protein [Streptomyces sp. NBC_01766]WSV53117.1 DUF3515 domain-containing protein [Streptomyces sp. NBC_01014]